MPKVQDLRTPLGEHAILAEAKDLAAQRALLIATHGDVD